MGKFIVIEGLDGSGKATQAALLARHLTAQGLRCRQISFPDYEHPSSALVKLYLGGALGGVDEVNAFAASAFYSVDRYASYRQFWREDYLGETVIVADRYTTSNATHQTSKLPRREWDGYLDWLEDFEYNKLGLPRPDGVIFLSMHPNTSRTLLERRYGGREERKDIHEADKDYLLKCFESARYVALRQGWRVVDCCDGQTPRAIEEIAARVAGLAGKIINGEK